MESQLLVFPVLRENAGTFNLISTIAPSVVAGYIRKKHVVVKTETFRETTMEITGCMLGRRNEDVNEDRYIVSSVEVTLEEVSPQPRRTELQNVSEGEREQAGRKRAPVKTVDVLSARLTTTLAL